MFDHQTAGNSLVSFHVPVTCCVCVNPVVYSQMNHWDVRETHFHRSGREKAENDIRHIGAFISPVAALMDFSPLCCCHGPVAHSAPHGLSKDERRADCAHGEHTLVNCVLSLCYHTESIRREISGLHALLLLIKCVSRWTGTDFSVHVYLLVAYETIRVCLYSIMTLHMCFCFI